MADFLSGVAEGSPVTATSADAVIIGAGVIGSSIALELAGTGRYIRTGVNEDSSFFVLG